MPPAPRLRPDRRAHDQALADGFRPSSAVLGLLFAVFGVWHAVEFDRDVARVMVPLALLTAALCAAVYVALGRRPLPPGQAHPVAAVLACAAYLNCVVQLLLTGDLHLTVNVLLLIIAIGVCLIDPRWVAGLCGGLAVSWVAAVMVERDATEVWRTVADVTIGLIVAAMANILRRRTLGRLLSAQAALRDLSERCELTGLLNRRGFLNEAQRRMDGGEALTLWFLDVDDLKPVNDRYGHDVGDVLLHSVAQALEDVFADSVVARLSGDEFAVAHTSPDSAADPDALARRQRQLDERLAQALGAPGTPVRVSTGTASSQPGQELNELLAAADAAMYVGKQAKRGSSVRT